MYWRILKKDLKHNKTMNLIFLAFMILCVLLLCSSGANIAISHNAINYFLDVSKVADQYYFASSYYDEEFDAWLTSCPYVESYEKAFYILPGKEDIAFNGEKLTHTQGITHMYLFTAINLESSRVFDENNKTVNFVVPGEVAMSTNIAKILGLKKGDFLDIRIGSETRALKVTTMIKDAVASKENIGFTRLFLSAQDYADLSAANQNTMTEWSIMTSDLEELRMDYKSKYIPINLEYSHDTISTALIAENFSSLILAIATAVIIIMALMLLQFAARLTMKEVFPEIAVMKAIGIKNSSVCRLYIIKYLVFSVAAAGIGLALSWPFGDFLIAPLKERIVIPEAYFGLGKIPAGFYIRLLCALGAVGVILLFCWGATQAMAKMPVTQAIGKGTSGERFRHKGILRLQGSRIKTILFLAINDILAELRSFVPLFLAFALGMLLVILPANMVSTLRSGNSLEFCGFSRVDAYSDSLAKTGLIRFREKTYLEFKEDLKNIEQQFADKGIQVEIDASITISSRVYNNDQSNSIAVLGFKRISEKPIDIPYFGGSAPKFANEIAMTEVLMKKLGVQLGDTVLLGIGQEEKKYIITGQIQAIYDNGHIIIFSSLDEPNFFHASTLHMVLIHFIDRNDILGQIKNAQKVFPEYNIVTAAGMIRNIFGGTIDTLNSLVILLFCISLIIACLVAYLISHALLVKDKPTISCLKSIGFANSVIRLWQILRIMIVTLAGVLFGIGLSFILNPLVTKMIFGAAGADQLPPQYDVLWTFIIYPILMVIAVLWGTLLAFRGISKISMRNNPHSL